MDELSLSKMALQIAALLQKIQASLIIKVSTKNTEKIDKVITDKGVFNFN